MQKFGDNDLAPLDPDLERTLRQIRKAKKNGLNLSRNQWRILKVIENKKR